MPVGIVMSQKMQVTGGLLGHDLGNESTSSSGSWLAVLTSELDKSVRFPRVAVIFWTVLEDKLFKGIETTSDKGKAGAGLVMVDSSLSVFWEGGSEEVEGGVEVLFPEVDFLEAVGGVGGGESNLGDELEEHFQFFICFGHAAVLPLVVLRK